MASFADVYSPLASTTAAWEAFSSGAVVFIMLITVPCALSVATGLRLASTRSSLP
jgi:hypothetical protein